MDDLPPEEGELREIPDQRMPLLQAALLRRSMDEYARTGDLCENCGRNVLTGEHVYVFSGGRVVCELCIGLEPEPPLETRVVHGPELGNTIRVVDKRSRYTSSSAVRPGTTRRRRRTWPRPVSEPPE